MTRWTRKVPGTDISVGGKDVPLSTPKFDPKALLEAGTASLRKGGAAILGPLTSWQRLPEQAQANKRPRFKRVTKDADPDPASSPDPIGRPSWMVPGFGQPDPQYPSQQPDGNHDTVFAQNIFVNSPPVPLVDEGNEYFLW